MTTVVVPYTTLAPGVAEALDATGSRWEAIDVSAADDMYWYLLSELWGEGETFIVVEHDILVRPDSITELEECTNNWCGFEAPYFNGVHAGLGCAKFGASLIASVPNAMELVAREYDDQHPPRHWCRLDAWLQWIVLPQAQQKRHLHSPPVGHWRPDGNPHPRPTHSCYPDEVTDSAAFHQA